MDFKFIHVDFQEQNQKLSIAENFVNMSFPNISETQKIMSSKAMDHFLLHADH